MPAKRTISGPGRLEGQVVIRLDTFDAVLALRGRPPSDNDNKKPRISGLYEFSSRLSTIYSAAEFGDPFAVYALVLVEDQLSETEKSFFELEKEVVKLKKAHASGKMTIHVPKSVKPVEYKLTLAHYGATAARLILRFDDLILEIKNLVHLNILPSATGREWTWRMAKIIRSLLSAAMRYRFTSVKSEDLKQGNQLANSAIKKLIQSGFLDMRQFKSKDEIIEFFVSYPYKPEFGPDSVVDEQTFADRAGRLGAPASSKYSMFIPRVGARKDVSDKPSSRDKSSKGPFKGKEEKKLNQRKAAQNETVPVVDDGQSVATIKSITKSSKKITEKRKEGKAE